MPEYVVSVHVLDPQQPSKWVPRYIAAVAAQAHYEQTPDRQLVCTSAEAFIFTERTAAEVIACMIGGSVITI